MTDHILQDIEAERQRRGLTLLQLANAAGWRESHLHRALKGGGMPHHRLVALCDVLGMRLQPCKRGGKGKREDDR